MDRKFDLKSWAKTIAQSPGVYQMFDQGGEVIYVGKAKKLRQRLLSYARDDVNVKTARLVAQIASIKTWLTQTDEEALLLEHNLIKQYRPKYNILLKVDDKSYPYLFLDLHQDYPTLSLHRGAKKKKGEYFGPFANRYAMDQAMLTLQKIFKLRTCSDHAFRCRSRPCMLYQIQRCSAPCVDLVSKEAYRQQVEMARDFLKGKTQALFKTCEKAMKEASESQRYEKAAEYRNIIRALQVIRTPNDYKAKDALEADVLAIFSHSSHCLVSMLMVRVGEIVNTGYYRLDNPLEKTTSKLLSSFISAHYLNQSAQQKGPTTIVIGEAIEDQAILSDALSEHFGHTISIQTSSPRYQKWLAIAEENARRYGGQKKSSYFASFKEDAIWQTYVPMDEINKVVCLDIAHLGGEHAVGSCVVFDDMGPDKKAFRHVALEGKVTPGDDYAAIYETLITYMKGLESDWPDLFLIDGGKGQLSAAKKALQEFQYEGQVVAMSKGPGRVAGYEHYWCAAGDFSLPPESSASHTLQNIRDAAHRLAGYWHRKKRMRHLKKGMLLDLPGVGKVRQKKLLTHFGGLRALREASPEAIAQVPGIGKKVAFEIFHALKEM